MKLEKKEKRDAILYVHVTKTNKLWLKSQYKKLGYSTLSDFVNDILNKLTKGKK